MHEEFDISEKYNLKTKKFENIFQQNYSGHIKICKIKNPGRIKTLFEGRKFDYAQKKLKKTSCLSRKLKIHKVMK